MEGNKSLRCFFVFQDIIRVKPGEPIPEVEHATTSACSEKLHPVPEGILFQWEDSGDRGESGGSVSLGRGQGQDGDLDPRSECRESGNSKSHTGSSGG